MKDTCLQQGETAPLSIDCDSQTASGGVGGRARKRGREGEMERDSPSIHLLHLHQDTFISLASSQDKVSHRGYRRDVTSLLCCWLTRPRCSVKLGEKKKEEGFFSFLEVNLLIHTVEGKNRLDILHNAPVTHTHTSTHTLCTGGREKQLHDRFHSFKFVRGTMRSEW